MIGDQIDNPNSKDEMDPKEKAEREEAAQAYAGEDEQHFVKYVGSCIKESVDAKLDIRQMQEECWRIYQEEEPDNWAMKEPWQSRIVYPKPNKLVQFGQAFARKAFDLDFLSIENERDPEAEELWVKLMGLMMTRNFANFPTKFSDATAMAMAVGTSMEIIPTWINGKGLQLILANPESIHRDPAAESREPWSGRYWIHQEYMPYYLLKEGGYENIDDLSIGGVGYQSYASPSNDLTQEEQARRKNMIFVASDFNPALLISEFWGTILSPKGEMLLPNARMTIACDRVIRKPEDSPYPTLRWPGVGFSTLPNLRRFEGRGLIQGIRGIWYFMCNLLSLHSDNLNWIVNPMTETNVQNLVDPMDNDLYPGKLVLVNDSPSGQMTVRVIDRNSQNNDILAILNKADMIHQDGGMIDYKTMGSPGYRQGVTKGEAAQDLEQGQTVMSSIASNIEDGALNAIMACAETIAINITYPELRKWLGPEIADKYKAVVDDAHPTGLNLPQLTTGTFKVSGIAAFMRHQENLRNLQQMEEMFQPGSTFLPYLKPYAYLKARVKYTNLVDTKILIDDTQAQAIDQAQQGQQEAAIGQEGAKTEAEAAGAQAEAVKHGALADKAGAESLANQEQAGLFQAQAGQVATAPPTPGYGGAV